MHNDSGKQSPCSGQTTPLNGSDTDSKVEYPLIDLKTGLKNELIEKTLKELKKASEASQKRKYGIAPGTSELNHGLLGKNKFIQFQMKKAINFQFAEQEYKLVKIRKAQMEKYEDLQKIHLEKRKQMRFSHEYRNEEIRKEVIKMRNEEDFVRKQRSLEDAMRRKRDSINELITEQRNLLKVKNLENSIKKKEKLKKGTSKENIKETVQESVNELQEPNLVNEFENKNKNEILTELEMSRSRSFLLPRALEVTKDITKPRTIEKSTDEMEILNSQVLPMILKTSISNNEKSMVSDMTKIECQSVSKKKNSNISETLENFIQLPPEIQIKNAHKSNKDIMKRRKLEKEKEIHKIATLPYIAYRRNSIGNIVKLDHPPLRKEFKEPSNKNKYKVRKMLDEERNRYKNSMLNLTIKTEKIIQEDIRKSDLFGAPKLDLRKEPYYERRIIGPAHWMKAFVSSNIPEDIDPSSTEAIIYCRYIRAPLESYSHLPNYLMYHTPL